MTSNTIKPRPTTGRRNTPVRVVIETEMPEAPEQVFEVLGDPENNPNWNWAVESTRPLFRGSLQRGSRYRQARIGPGDAHLLEVTRYQPPEEIEVVGQLDEGEARYRYRLQPTQPGGTRPVTTVELTPAPGLPGGRLFAARLEQAVASNLDALRSLVGEITSGAPRS